MIRFLSFNDICDANYKKLLKELLKDNEINELLSYNFTANAIIKLINKLMSLMSYLGLELKKDVCRLVLATMSGLQTIEYVNDNKSLDCLIHSYMKRSIQMD